MGGKKHFLFKNAKKVENDIQMETVKAYMSCVNCHAVWGFYYVIHFISG